MRMVSSSVPVLASISGTKDGSASRAWLRSALKGLATFSTSRSPDRSRDTPVGSGRVSTKRVKVGWLPTRIATGGMTRAARWASAIWARRSASRARRVSSSTTSAGRAGGGPRQLSGSMSTNSRSPASIALTVTRWLSAKRSDRPSGSRRTAVT
ncbi:hypothetical protein BN1110_04151 [bacterium YEK0313]|nr:hypothetical protein BN1110_04151 [bacterium YEK0313]